MDTKRQEILVPVVAGGPVQRKVAVIVDSEPVSDYDRLKLRAEREGLTGKEADFTTTLERMAKDLGIARADLIVPLVAEKMRGGA